MWHRRNPPRLNLRSSVAGPTRLQGDRRTMEGTALNLREVNRAERDVLMSELAEEIAGYLFSPERMKDFILKTSTTKRKASRFEPNMVSVADTPNSPTLVAERNRDRIEIVFLNVSGGTIFIGGKSVKSTAGPDQGIPLASGNSFTLDSTTDAVYAIPTGGGGALNLNFFESVE
jgi:hypothetical protein